MADTADHESSNKLEVPQWKPRITQRALWLVVSRVLVFEVKEIRSCVSFHDFIINDVPAYGCTEEYLLFGSRNS